MPLNLITYVNLPSHTLLFSEHSEDLAQGLTMQILLLFQGPTNNDKTKEYAFRLNFFKVYKKEETLLTYLPQHFSKTKSFGGPFSSFMEKLFQCSAGLYNRPPETLAQK